MALRTKRIGIVVKDVDEIVKNYKEILGMEPISRDMVTPLKAEINGVSVNYTLKLAFFSFGEMEIEFMELSSGLSRHLFMDQGEISHVTQKVDDLDEAVKFWEDHGIKVIQRADAGHHKYAFVDAREKLGVVFKPDVRQRKNS